MKKRLNKKQEYNGKNESMYIERMPFKQDKRLFTIWIVIGLLLIIAFLIYAINIGPNPPISLVTSMAVVVLLQMILTSLLNKKYIGRWIKTDLYFVIATLILLIIIYSFLG